MFHNFSSRESRTVRSRQRNEAEWTSEGDLKGDAEYGRRSRHFVNKVSISEGMRERMLKHQARWHRRIDIILSRQILYRGSFFIPRRKRRDHYEKRSTVQDLFGRIRTP